MIFDDIFGGQPRDKFFDIVYNSFIQCVSESIWFYDRFFTVKNYFFKLMTIHKRIGIYDHH